MLCRASISAQQHCCGCTACTATARPRSSGCEQPERAAEDAQRATELQPLWPWGHFLLGQALRTLGRIQPALVALRKSLELGPDDPNTETELNAALEMAQKMGPASF